MRYDQSRMKDLKSKCTCSAGGAGIFLCVIFMSLAVVGTAAVGISKNADNGNTDGSTNVMSTMSTTKSSTGGDNTHSSIDMSSASQNIIVSFFSGSGGQIILLLSFIAMFAGIWFGDRNNRKLLAPISAIGAVMLYISMYNYYSIALEVTGAIILGFVYASAFSHRLAKTIRLA